MQSAILSHDEHVQYFRSQIQLATTLCICAAPDWYFRGGLKRKFQEMFEEVAGLGELNWIDDGLKGWERYKEEKTQRPCVLVHGFSSYRQTEERREAVERCTRRRAPGGPRLIILERASEVEKLKEECMKMARVSILEWPGERWIALLKTPDAGEVIKRLRDYWLDLHDTEDWKAPLQEEDLDSLNIQRLDRLDVLLVTGRDAEAVLRADPDVEVVIAGNEDLLAAPSLAETPLCPGDERWHLEKVGVDRAHQAGFRGKDVRIGILDTGLERSHDEFQGQDPLEEVFVDHRGYVSIEGKSVHDHGSHVAGIAAGASGVAPEADLVSVCAFHGTTATAYQVIKGLRYLIEAKVDVVNLSFGTPDHDSLGAIIPRLLKFTTVVAAIGNGGHGTHLSPAIHRDVIAVGASGRDDKWWSGSSRGPTSGGYWKPDFVAPGQGIRSAVLNNAYKSCDGTSMATAVVTGLAALIIQKIKKDSPGARVTQERLRQELLDRVQRWTAEGTPFVHWGLP